LREGDGSALAGPCCRKPLLGAWRQYRLAFCHCCHCCLPSSPHPPSEVPRLQHELRDDAVEDSALVVEGLAALAHALLAGAQRAAGRQRGMAQGLACRARRSAALCRLPRRSAKAPTGSSPPSWARFCRTSPSQCGPRACHQSRRQRTPVSEDRGAMGRRGKEAIGNNAAMAHARTCSRV
jgi:hypothetical protein